MRPYLKNNQRQRVEGHGSSDLSSRHKALSSIYTSRSVALLHINHIQFKNKAETKLQKGKKLIHLKFKYIFRYPLFG
jgi:hypothetical protein